MKMFHIMWHQILSQDVILLQKQTDTSTTLICKYAPLDEITCTPKNYFKIISSLSLTCIPVLYTYVSVRSYKHSLGKRGHERKAKKPCLVTTPVTDTLSKKTSCAFICIKPKVRLKIQANSHEAYSFTLIRS